MAITPGRHSAINTWNWQFMPLNGKFWIKNRMRSTTSHWWSARRALRCSLSHRSKHW